MSLETARNLGGVVLVLLAIGGALWVSATNTYDWNKNEKDEAPKVLARFLVIAAAVLFTHIAAALFILPTP